MSLPPLNTMLLDTEAWDLVLDSSGNIAMAQPPYALAQDVASAIKTFSGEVWYDTTLGIPYLTSIFGKLPPSSTLVELFNTTASTQQGVVAVQTTFTSFTNRNLSGQVEIIDSNNVSSGVTF